MTWKLLLNGRALALGCAAMLGFASAQGAAVPRDYSVELSARVEVSPPRIHLQWPAHATANSYNVLRKGKTEGGWTHIGDVSGSATGFTDSNVSVGSAFEYQVRKQTSENYTGYGFTFAGINAPLVEHRGKVLVVVDNRLAGPLAAELDRLLRDLVGDGWIPIRRDVSPSDSVQHVKNVIRTEWNADKANLRSVFLFGAIPVPYSGDLAPDDHDNHKGAWPADVFYAEMDGQWTDQTVTSQTAERAINHNVPGDGKFDQSEIPTLVELELGRVDLSNMTSFSNKTPPRSELDLLRQYLNKDHRFRHRQITVERRGIICDYFGFRRGDPIVGSGWRNMTAILGQGKVTQVPEFTWLDAVTSGSYLMSWAAGGGSYYYSSGVASSDDFALQDIRVVFAMFLGSYYGDWNNESNFIRAALGSSSYTLTSTYAGYPQHLYHHMALGETVGYGIKLTQNHDGKVYAVTNRAERQIHISLHGDPTLRAHPVIPARSLQGQGTAGGVQLSWLASGDTDLAGYNIYRSASEFGPFTKVNTSLVTGTSHTDPAPQGRFTYMVRAVKLELSGSGTYYNASQGIFVTVDSTGGGTAPTPPAAPANLSATANGRTSITLAWTDNSTNETEFQIDRRTEGGSFSRLTAVAANAAAHTDNGLASGTKYYYRVRAVNAAGQSAFTAEASATTEAEPPPMPPAAPTGLAASATSHREIRLTWTDNSANETQFVVERQLGRDPFAQIAVLGANTTGHIDSAVSPSTTYSYRVRAVNSVGSSLFSNEAQAATPAAPSPTNPGAATFIATDLTTKGSWTAAYGADGYMIPGGTAEYPAYGAVQMSGHTLFVWQPTSVDPRALFQSDAGTARLASAWYGVDGINLEVRLNDASPHRVAIYFLDWDNLGRAQTITIRDLVTDEVLDTRSVSDFNGGKYLVWDLRGHVKISVAKTAGPNALVTGLFFGETPEPINDDIILNELNYTGTAATFKISGPAGLQVIVEASTDLIAWAEVGSGTLVDGSMTHTDSQAHRQTTRFYRVRRQ